MHIKYLIPILFLSVFVSLTSCVKQQPQLPSNKGKLKDKNVEILLDLNQNLALKEDSILQAYVKHDAFFKKNELGFWYKITKSTNKPLIKNNIGCKFNCKLMLFNGKVLQVDIKQIKFGKKQIVTGLEEGLKLLHKDESATFIIPWYLGFGMNGNEPLIPPYTSIIYEIKHVD